MIQNYMDAFNVSPISKRFKLLLEYYDVSQEYDRNFETLHEAWRNGDKVTWQWHLNLEKVLYKKCKKLRVQLDPNIDKAKTYALPPNATCNQCHCRYTKDVRIDTTYTQKKTGICKDCIRMNAKEYRNQLKVNKGLIDVTTNMNIMPE